MVKENKLVNEDKLKIVMFTDSYWPRVNGVSVSVESFSSALIKIGHQVLIICPYYPESHTQTSFTKGAYGNTAPSVIPEISIIRVPSLPVFISK